MASNKYYRYKKQRLTKFGDSYYILVPSFVIKQNELNIELEYDVSLRESGEEGEDDGTI